jgi:hypothetical protein
MSLQALTDNSRDEMNIAFLEEATEEFDTYDTRKMFAFEGDAAQIYSEQNNEQLGINGLPPLTEYGYDVKVGYKVGIDGDQIIEADLRGMDEVEVILEDMVTGEMQSLVDNPTYKFEGFIDDDDDRFVLHFNPVYTTVEDNSPDLGIRVYAYDGAVYIQSTGKAATESKKVWIYDMFGRTVLQTNIHPSSVSKVAVDNNNTYLIVKTVSESGVTIDKIYIK